jgi:hypothetical protein
MGTTIPCRNQTSSAAAASLAASGSSRSSGGAGTGGAAGADQAAASSLNRSALNKYRDEMIYGTWRFLKSPKMFLPASAINSGVFDIARIPVDKLGIVTKFTQLTDAPASYVGQAGKVVAVNVTETGLEFVTGGTGSAGLIGSNLTITGTPANLTPTILSSVVLPANNLKTDGVGIRLRAWGTTGANNNQKMISLVFGGTIVATNNVDTNPDGQPWELTAVIFRRAMLNQEANGGGAVGAVRQSVQLSQPAEDETSNITITVVGQNGVASANDIVCRGLFVEAV